MEKQQVKKYTPDTSCTKIPKELCAPKSCNIVEVGHLPCLDSIVPMMKPLYRHTRARCSAGTRCRPWWWTTPSRSATWSPSGLASELLTNHGCFRQLLFRKKTKLVPRLVASQECVDVPKEICARSKINPRRVQKPAIQRWCYEVEEDHSVARKLDQSEEGEFI